MTCILLNVLRLALWTRMWAILEDALCRLEKYVYSSVVDLSVL